MNNPTPDPVETLAWIERDARIQRDGGGAAWLTDEDRAGARRRLNALCAAGWRIVRTGAEWNRTTAPGADPETVFVMDAEWVPGEGVVE